MSSALRQVMVASRQAGALGGHVALAPLQLPRAAARLLLEPVRSDIRRSVRRSFGLSDNPPPRTVDPQDAFLPPDGVARSVHGDLPSMVIGGLAALLLQTLHPLAMAGVADHSNYREEAISRLRRTATFVGVTTFGSREEAAQVIDQVRQMHRHVVGTAPDGRRYSADDPELLTWVHVAETWCFLHAAERFGPHSLSSAQCDLYISETAVIARSLGARWVPGSVDEMTAYFHRVRPELYAGPQALDARDFLLRGVGTRPNDRAVYALIVAAAVSLLPHWARRELHLAAPSTVEPWVDTLLVAPLGRAFSAAVRWTVSPPHPTPADPTPPATAPGA